MLFCAAQRSYNSFRPAIDIVLKNAIVLARSQPCPTSKTRKSAISTMDTKIRLITNLQLAHAGKNS